MQQALTIAQGHIGVAGGFVDYVQADVDMVDDCRCAASCGESWAFGVEYAAFHEERAPSFARQADADDAAADGCTVLEPDVFPNLVSYIERGEIRPVVAATYDLSDIVKAQEAFLTKQHVGKIVLSL